MKSGPRRCSGRGCVSKRLAPVTRSSQSMPSVSQRPRAVIHPDRSDSQLMLHSEAVHDVANGEVLLDAANEYDMRARFQSLYNEEDSKWVI
jgi:hypothetical protein